MEKGFICISIGFDDVGEVHAEDITSEASLDEAEMKATDWVRRNLTMTPFTYEVDDACADNENIFVRMVARREGIYDL